MSELEGSRFRRVEYLVSIVEIVCFASKNTDESVQNPIVETIDVVFVIETGEVRKDVDGGFIFRNISEEMILDI